MIRRNALALSLLALFGTAAHAQGYPQKPIRLLVPFAAGGTTDLIARIISEPLGRELGQPVVVENKGGGGGSIGAAETARATPDGYNLGMATVSTTATNPAINPKIPYNVFTDFTPVVNVAATPNVIAANPQFAGKDYKSFLAEVKKNPGKYSFGSPGTGSIGHLMMEMFMLETGAQMIHVPYRGSAAAITALLSGEVDMMFDNLPSAIGQIQAGKLRALAVTTAQRSTALPDVPTLAEAGMDSFNVSAWFGVAAPAGLPAPVATRLADALQKVVQQPEVAAAMQRQGADPAFMDAASAAAALNADAAQWKQVAVFAKIQLD